MYRNAELTLDTLFLIDAILTFFTGVPSSDAKNWTSLRDIIDWSQD